MIIRTQKVLKHPPKVIVLIRRVRQLLQRQSTAMLKVLELVLLV
nr:MAG TPA: hypothetical protein [Bacteriophage sp.]